MVFASSTASVLSMLLLSLMLFHRGLQTPVRRSHTCHSPSGAANTLSCNNIVQEIMWKLQASDLTENDVRAQLRNETLQRVNLCEFLKMREQKNIKNATKDIKSNLEKLECCLPVTVGTSKVTGIYLENNLKDFKKKLRFFLSQLNNLKLVPTPGPLHPTSDSVTSRPVIMEC